MKHIQIFTLLCTAMCSLYAIPYGYYIHNPELLQQKTDALIDSAKASSGDVVQNGRLEKIEAWHQALTEAGPMYDKYASVIENFVNRLRSNEKLQEASNDLRATMKKVKKDAARAKKQKLIGNTSHIDLQFLQTYVQPVVEVAK